MQYEDIPINLRRKLYDRVYHIWKTYGVRIKARDLFMRMEQIKRTRAGMSRPILCSRDGSWLVHTLFWKQSGTRPDKKGYYLSGNRWYVRGVRGLSFKTEAEVKRHLA